MSSSSLLTCTVSVSGTTSRIASSTGCCVSSCICAKNARKPPISAGLIFGGGETGGNSSESSGGRGGGDKGVSVASPESAKILPGDSDLESGIRASEVSGTTSVSEGSAMAPELAVKPVISLSVDELCGES